MNQRYLERKIKCVSPLQMTVKFKKPRQTFHADNSVERGRNSDGSSPIRTQGKRTQSRSHGRSTTTTTSTRTVGHIHC